MGLHATFGAHQQSALQLSATLPRCATQQVLALALRLTMLIFQADFATRASMGSGVRCVRGSATVAMLIPAARMQVYATATATLTAASG